MIEVKIDNVPKEWLDDEDTQEYLDLIGTIQMVQLKNGYVVLPNYDNLPLEFTTFVSDLDDNMTKEEYEILKKTT